MKNSYNVIGIMSGTSLDGVDIAYCNFKFTNKWEYKIIKAQTIPYKLEWVNKLSEIYNTDARTFCETNALYGHYLGKLVKKFIEEHKIKPDFISSHGHTVFHQPEIGMTTQLGLGAAIMAESCLPVVCDFRTSDVALGGQGAPLVPIGDILLFEQYDYCLNIGGFANISHLENKKITAFDICPANFVLNYLSINLGQAFDKDGIIASSGMLNTSLLKDLNNLNFYKSPSPKSLGKEWVDKEIIPLLKKYNISTEDKLRTYSEHIALQISFVINSKKNSSLFITGGGTHNKFLIERIIKNSSSNIVIPNKLTIDFKEALIFAFLGVLRWTHQPNSLKSVTGAKRDNIGGCIYIP